MSEKLEQYKERVAGARENGGLSEDVQTLLSDMLEELAELSRSNKALRKVILKNGQGSAMSTRLRDALYE